jgi:hypothetical protein
MILALIGALALQAKGEAPTATWMTDYAAASARAKKLGKPLVIDAGREA